ncbi:MAG: hypothetical protein ACI398_05140 [Clostridium sp.]
MISLNLGASLTTLFITLIVSGILLLLLLLFYYISLAVDSWNINCRDFKDNELKSLDEPDNSDNLKENKEEIKKENMK